MSLFFYSGLKMLAAGRNDGKSKKGYVSRQISPCFASAMFTYSSGKACRKLFLGIEASRERRKRENRENRENRGGISRMLPTPSRSFDSPNSSTYIRQRNKPLQSHGRSCQVAVSVEKNNTKHRLCVHRAGTM
jgi:hypothetical protein